MPLWNEKELEEKIGIEQMFCYNFLDIFRQLNLFDILLFIFLINN